MAGLLHFLPKVSFLQGMLEVKHPRRSPLILRMMVLGAVMLCSIYMSFICLKQTSMYIKPQSTKAEPLESYSYDSRIADSDQRKIQGNPDIMIAKPAEEHSGDPVILGLNQMKAHSNQELPIKQRSSTSYDTGVLDLEQPTTQNQGSTRKKPMEEKNSYDPIENLESTTTPIEEEHSYESKTVVLEQPVTNEKPEYAVTIPVEGEHSFDHNIVGLKQADVQTKSETVSKDPVVQHSNDSRVINFNESMIQTKAEPIVMKPIELNSYDHRIAGFEGRKTQIKPEFVRTNVSQPSCPDPGIAQSEIPYIHYPVPTSYSRRECACTPVRFYVIISMQRSGSKWLESLLISHVNISSNGELFIVPERRANLSALTDTLDKVYNLEWRHSTNKKACMAAVGFKWMLNQGIMNNYDEVYKYFKRRGVLVIFLFRRNLLRRMISLVANAKDHGQVNGTHKAHVSTQQEAEILASYKPKLNAKLLVSRLKEASRIAAEAVERFKSIRHKVLYYEDLVQNTTQKMSEVLEFLGVPQRRLSSNHVKIHNRPLSELVSNWNAVQRVLKRSQFASFLTLD